MNQRELLHEIRTIMTIHLGIQNARGKRSDNLRKKIANRSVAVLEIIVARPDILCMFKCPNKK